ncbi:MAG: Na+/H+ antiporter subunit E [Actinobacteria bacterium]|nr:Na+/H+ antiporter subunit E [Actinomycetota bacterium]MCB9390383.1 Na+/H+ antiporter subunit E [Acidimicrobiia bacterium]
MKRGVFMGWLVLVWCLLWGSFSLANLLSGTALALVMWPTLPGQGPATSTFRPLPALRLTGYFLVLLARSNVAVAKEVVTPGSSVRPGIIAVPVAPMGRFLLAALGNMITLTPGTMTVDVDVDGDDDGAAHDAVLYVHVMHLFSAEQSTLDILDMQAALLNAFGSRGSIADVDARRDDLRRRIGSIAGTGS